MASTFFLRLFCLSSGITSIECFCIWIDFLIPAIQFTGDFNFGFFFFYDFFPFFSSGCVSSFIASSRSILSIDISLQMITSLSLCKGGRIVPFTISLERFGFTKWWWMHTNQIIFQLFLLSLGQVHTIFFSSSCPHGTSQNWVYIKNGI